MLYVSDISICPDVHVDANNTESNAGSMESGCSAANAPMPEGSTVLSQDVQASFPVC